VLEPPARGGSRTAVDARRTVVVLVQTTLASSRPDEDDSRPTAVDGSPTGRLGGLPLLCCVPVRQDGDRGGGKRERSQRPQNPLSAKAMRQPPLQKRDTSSSQDHEQPSIPSVIR